MKTLKLLTLALIFSCATQSCTQNEAAPNYEVANCGKITDPLKDIGWLKVLVESAITNKTKQQIIMYDYRNEKIYHTISKYSTMVFEIGNCDGSIRAMCSDPACSESYTKIMKEAKNPIVLFEQK